MVSDPKSQDLAGDRHFYLEPIKSENSQNHQKIQSKIKEIYHEKYNFSCIWFENLTFLPRSTFS
jgi:hypothetical protein